MKDLRDGLSIVYCTTRSAVGFGKFLKVLDTRMAFRFSLLKAVRQMLKYLRVPGNLYQDCDIDLKSSFPSFFTYNMPTIPPFVNDLWNVYIVLFLLISAIFPFVSRRVSFMLFFAWRFLNLCGCKDFDKIPIVTYSCWSLGWEQLKLPNVTDDVKPERDCTM